VGDSNVVAVVLFIRLIDPCNSVIRTRRGHIADGVKLKQAIEEHIDYRFSKKPTRQND